MDGEERFTEVDDRGFFGFAVDPRHGWFWAEGGFGEVVNRLLHWSHRKLVWLQLPRLPERRYPIGMDKGRRRIRVLDKEAGELGSSGPSAPRISAFNDSGEGNFYERT